MYERVYAWKFSSFLLNLLFDYNFSPFSNTNKITKLLIAFWEVIKDLNYYS